MTAPTPGQPDDYHALERLVRDLESYSSLTVGRPLHPYQLEPGRAILRAALNREGGAVSVMMSRQAGKNELSAHLEAYLLTRFRLLGGSIVKAAPTYRPQVLQSRLRLEETLKNPLAELTPPDPQHGFLLALGQARIFFLSAEPSASVVGATASLLLEVDEAQDVDPEKHDSDFAPMTVSTNAPRVYYGVAGRADDLLQRVKARNLELEKRDGIRRHFEYPWWVVAEHNPAYARAVQAERDRLGPHHPLFKSQYELAPVAPDDALLDDLQLRLLQGDHPRQAEPTPDRFYVAGVDVAGSLERDPDPGASARRPDSTVVTVCEVERQTPESPDDPLAPSTQPLIRVVHIVEWVGRSHRAQHVEILRLLDDTWRCRIVAFDATGLGEAPAEFVKANLGDRLLPIHFTAQLKSQMGYDLVAAVDTERLKMYAAAADDRHAAAFWAQIRALRRQMHGAGLMAWSAPRGHDDYATSLALAVHAARHAPPEHAYAVVPYRDPYSSDGRY